MAQCLNWICFHEIGHLSLNHIGILGSNYHTEVRQKADDNGGTINHILEFEADTFAVLHQPGIEMITQTLTERLDFAKKNSTYKGEWFEPSRQLAARLMHVTPFILTLILSHNNRKYTDTHPVPPARFEHLMNMLGEKMLRSGGINNLIDKESLVKDINSISTSAIHDKCILEYWNTESDFNSFSHYAPILKDFHSEYGTFAERMPSSLLINQ